MIRFTLILFALIVAVPGYARAQSEATYGVVVERDVMVTMRDGTRLAIDVWRPDAPGHFPALVERTPYDKTRSSEIRAGAHEFFASRGYVFLVQDVRGRYASQGDFYPFRDAGWGARSDGADTVQWIAAQSWSDGKVGVLGGSHTGQTAYMVAPTQPPALVAMFVRESASDLHAHWIYRGGAFEHGFTTLWTALTFAPDVIARTLTAAPRGVAEAAMAALLEDREAALAALPIAGSRPFAAIDGLAFYDDWLAHQADGPYWRQQRIADAHPSFTVPVAHLGGWYDIFLAGTIDNYLGLRANAGTAAARAGQKLVIGPWVHGPTNVGVAEVGALSFPGADQVSYNEVRLRWFDHWLRGIDTGLMDEPPVLIYVMGDNVWRHEEEWPPARAVATKFHLRAGDSGTIESLYDGRLEREAPRQAAVPARFRYDPFEPVATLGGNTLFIASGPQDHRAADARSLTFTSPPLADDLEVTGPVTAVLYAASSAVDTDWTVRLGEVYPDGRSINIVDGIQRARYRADPAVPALIEPGKVYRYEIDLWATSTVFRAGNRLRVSIHSSNFPRWSRNLNTAESPEQGSHAEVATNSVFLDPDHPSHIVLPVIPR